MRVQVLRRRSSRQAIWFAGATLFLTVAAADPGRAAPTAQDIARERMIGQIENRLHQNAAGIFVVVISRTDQVYDKQHRRYAPVMGNYVEQYPDRHAAAVAVTDCLIAFQTTKPKPGTPRNAPRPQINFNTLGHFKTKEEAATAVDRARATFKTQGTLLDDLPSPQ